MKLTRDFFERNSVDVAKELLGKVLVYNGLSGIICETEAYRGEDDEACHAARGMTPRNKPMFGPGGFSYIYFIYGMYYCLNISTESEGFPGAVLIRAIQPLDGLETMIQNRKGKKKGIADGPGKLCQALGLTKEQNNLDMIASSLLYVENRDFKPKKIHSSSRIGISSAHHLEWRFYAHDFKKQLP